MKKWITALFLMSMVCGSQATVVADIDADWDDWKMNEGSAPTELGWSFQWNGTDQALQTGTWTDMAVSSWRYSASGDNSTVTYSSAQLAAFNEGTIKDADENVIGYSLSSTYGGANSYLSTDELTHYSILSYTIGAGEGGTGTINSSGTIGEQSEMYVFLTKNGSSTRTQLDYRSGTKFGFTLDDVDLAEGDVVSVAFACLLQDADAEAANYVEDLTAINKNTTRLYQGLTIETIPEPATLGLLSVFGGALMVLRRRCRR